jgi:aminopeptidase 2
MGQTSLLGASVALLLLINIMGATVIPRRELHFNSDRFSESSEARTAGDEYRLPLTVTPELYTITLTPDYNDFATFTGEVEILVNATKNENFISLHYDNISIDSRTVTEINGRKLDLVDDDDDENNYNQATNIYTLRLLSENLTPGTRYKINIKYKGHLLDDMAGFYRSSYTTEDGEKR